MHPIFTNDPIEFNNYIDKIVRIETTDGEIQEGTVYTVDPVSGSFVLVNEKEKLSISIVFSHAVKCIQSVGEGRLIKPFPSEDELASEDIVTARRKLKKWLEANLLHVEESGDTLELAASQLTILPPYTKETCFSFNEIVLKRVHTLIDSMPV